MGREPEHEPAAKPAPSPRQVLAAWERGVASRVVADSVVARRGQSSRPEAVRLEAPSRLRTAVLRATEPRPHGPAVPLCSLSKAPLQSADFTSPDHAGGG